jgi:hypothetical protein
MLWHKKLLFVYAKKQKRKHQHIENALQGLVFMLSSVFPLRKRGRLLNNKSSPFLIAER